MPPSRNREADKQGTALTCALQRRGVKFRTKSVMRVKFWRQKL